MPEGHTLHKAARKQAPLLVDAIVRASSPQGRFLEVQLLDRARVVSIEAVGKHLFYGFERRKVMRWLHVHLGLAGRFTYHPTTRKPAPEPLGSVRLRLVAEGTTLDLRGPLICEVVTAERAAEIRDNLGPDPIRPRSTPARFIARLARSKVPVGAMIMDQSVIAGVGNVYRAELLYLARIDPRRASRDISATEAQLLWGLARKLLRAGVTDGRILTTKYGDVAPLHASQRTFAYKQAVCARCRGMIWNVKLGGRPCFYCPHCQT